MSTKITVRHGPQYHLYKECLDNEHIYLSLESINFTASSSVEFVGPPSVTLQLPRALAVCLGLVRD